MNTLMIKVSEKDFKEAITHTQKTSKNNYEYA